MKVFVNGKEIDVAEGSTVSGFLKGAAYPLEKIIVATNGEILKKDKWDISQLTEGDHLEIVSFVGGG